MSHVAKVLYSPAEMEPHPMRRQCFSTLRDRAIFSNTLVQTGDVSCSFARSCFTYRQKGTAHQNRIVYDMRCGNTMQNDTSSYC